MYNRKAMKNHGLLLYDDQEQKKENKGKKKKEKNRNENKKDPVESEAAVADSHRDAFTVNGSDFPFSSCYRGDDRRAVQCTEPADRKHI